MFVRTKSGHSADARFPYLTLLDLWLVNRYVDVGVM
jgi:hypothetical protein